MFGDVTDFHQRHHPQNIPHLVEEMKGFPLKTKSFRNTVTSQKLKGGGGSINPSPPWYHGLPRWGYDFPCLCPRVKRCYKSYHYWVLTRTTKKRSRCPDENQRRSTNLILTGWSGTVSSFWRKSSGSWWYSKRNLWSNCNKEKWRIRGLDISEITLFSACERCRRILSSLLSTRKVTLRVERSNVRKYVCVRSRLNFFVPSWAQLFEGQLALNPGLNLTPVSSLVFKSILSHNFLCYF